MTPDKSLPRDFVLLVNAKNEKGYGLILDVAALQPQIPFVCIASQSETEEASEAVRVRALTNVHIISRTDDMDSLYRAAKVVAVPSYRFVESFSRVCIEGHRFGKPVIGSDVGNVPYLLQKSGIVLAEDASAWATELGRLYADDAHYAAVSAAARENSVTYSYANQRKAILSVVRHAQDPILVGVGSGIGNMIHVAPMIRRLAEHFGRPIDLLVAEDHSDSLFLLHNPAYVNAVYSLRQYALGRHYSTVFLTHSFGQARLPFRAKRVIWSRDWALFHPDHPLHEALFNLEAAKQLLGVDYTEEDGRKSYIGEITYRWPKGDLVGFHGGSKDGFWVSKRWSYYSELAARLRNEGYRVASFGTPGEYVEGTEDMTGGTIEEMAKRMLSCSYFVGNDSGVMHLANALGIPLIAIFGPTNPRTRGPLRQTSRALGLVKDCAPCECKNPAVFLSGQCRCIGEIPLEEVCNAFNNLVETQHATPTSVTRQLA
jgi:ADP-heptose:LPS heptosyltransferase